LSLALNFGAFLLGSTVSLATSWVLVSRIERVANRLGVTEALLGMIAALAADTPEITSSVSALLGHRQSVGAGVVIGSNVFNFAALLGLGALVAGRIPLHRRVVLLNGTVGIWIAVVCLATITGLLTVIAGLILVVVVFGPFIVLTGIGRSRLRAAPIPEAARRWLEASIEEEESELHAAVEHRRANLIDSVTAGCSLIVVVAASVAMERSASTLGTHFAIPSIVIGAVVLAAVTSLPNAVSAIYLARRGRGTAMLSTAFNSNAINILAGFLVPASILGLATASGQETLVTVWYVGLTVVVVGLALWRAGLGRGAACVIVLAYAAFLSVLIVVA
jgi:cation:H+ antiporter